MAGQIIWDVERGEIFLSESEERSQDEAKDQFILNARLIAVDALSDLLTLIPTHMDEDEAAEIFRDLLWERDVWDRAKAWKKAGAK